MNKNMLFIAALTTGGFLALTAFQGKKTLEQQRAEITAQVDVRLGELRMQKEMECNDRVLAEATRRYDEMMANQTATPTPSGPARGNTTRPKGPRVDPIPQPAPPAQNPKQNKMEGGSNSQEKQNKMSGEAPNTDSKKKKMQGGGN